LERVVVGQTALELVQGDITQQDTDAIVNAANRRLAPGGGVAGAIHRAAGPDLWEACRAVGGCETGDAVLTPGYELRARYVIHTVGPVHRGHARDAADLAACYRNSLRLAEAQGMTILAFPAISTGAFGYPLEAAAKQALATVMDHLEGGSPLRVVRFVLYSPAAYAVFQRVLHSQRPRR
jgi:O-acetyl-ADP-ribose deacetylase (regulator of RNase III)